MGKVKVKGKKKDRPQSELVASSCDDAKTTSASLPPGSSNALKTGLAQKKAKTLSTIDVDNGKYEDETDGKI